MLSALAVSLVVAAGIRVEPVDYTDKDGTALAGLVAFDDAATGKRPAVVVVHDWLGITELTGQRIKELAALGYVAFAADIYGKGVRPKDAKAAGEQAGKFKSDRALMRRRAQAAVDVVAARKDVDVNRVAAMGFCFGGTTAIELAKSGARLAGVVSFHGGLDAPVAGDSKNIKGKVLVLHGAADPFVPQKDIDAFVKDLNDAKVDWTMTSYAGAVHAFTVPAAGNDPSKGAAYDEKVSKRAFIAMKDFFDEVFAPASFTSSPR
jgi:dienelactone hydrolase